MSALATHASSIASSGQAYWVAAAMFDDLGAILEQRAIVDQAKGVLIASRGLTAQDAFDELRRGSLASHRKLIEVARDVVDEALNWG